MYVNIHFVFYWEGFLLLVLFDYVLVLIDLERHLFFLISFQVHW